MNSKIKKSFIILLFFTFFSCETLTEVDNIEYYFYKQIINDYLNTYKMDSINILGFTENHNLFIDISIKKYLSDYLLSSEIKETDRYELYNNFLIANKERIKVKSRFKLNVKTTIINDWNNAFNKSIIYFTKAGFNKKEISLLFIVL